MLPRPHSALVIVGHGSTLNPDSSAPTFVHADTIRRRGLFAEVVCAFWKEEPSLREVLRTVDSPEVFVVPNFISEGYFTQEVIPRELGLTGKTTQFPRHTVHYCDPVGLHPSMTKLLLKRAEEVAPGVPRSECSLIIVGHGTGLNENSTKAIKDQVALIRSMDCGFAEVLDAHMEEQPLVADWAKLTTAPNVIVVPFFIADGLHSWQDIPVLLGIESEPGAAASEVDVFRHNPRRIHGRNLYYSSAIGTEPLLAEVIQDQVEARSAGMASRLPVLVSPTQEANTGRLSPCRRNISEALSKLGDHTRLGEVLITRSGTGFTLRHHLDSGLENLTRHTAPEAARDIAKFDAAGKFRPLKSAPTLARGWELSLPDAAALQLALECLYPAAVANWLRHTEAPIATLRETLNRQTGIYRVTALIRDDEAQQLVASTCSSDKCLRHILWPLDAAQSWTFLPGEKQSAVAPLDEIPLFCTDACPLLVGGARSAVKRRMKAEQPA
jgi:sirohydrochlorin cobaltochelatase